MTKAWNTISWILILIAQYANGFALVYLYNILINPDQRDVISMSQFLFTPLGIWLGYFIGVYATGMLGLYLKKIKPMVPALRAGTTAVLGIVPMLMLIFNGSAVGMENMQQFRDLVFVRMVPYYTQLCAVFALLGFYITLWWHKSEPKNAAKVMKKKSKTG